MSAWILPLFFVAIPAQAPQDAQASILHFSENFEDGALLDRGFYDGSGRFSLVEDAATGKKALEYVFEKGKILPGGSDGVRRLFPPGESVYLRFRIKLSPGWRWTGRPYGPHVFCIMTTENDRYHGPAASRLTVYVEPVGGKLRLAAQDIQNRDAPHGLTQGPLRGGYNGKFYDSQPLNFEDGQWHLVEAYFRLNTLDLKADEPRTDGIVQAWFDGKLVVDRNDVVLRSTDFPEMKFRQLLMAPYFHEGVPQRQWMRIDDLAVGSGRISNPGGK